MEQSLQFIYKEMDARVFKRQIGLNCQGLGHFSIQETANINDRKWKVTLPKEGRTADGNPGKREDWDFAMDVSAVARGVYPSNLPQNKELNYAANVFRSIEINGTFYSLQRPSSFEKWTLATPDDFVFSVKGSRFITHIKRLASVRTPPANFLASGLLRLGPKLGPILRQLPPNFQFDARTLENFLKTLARDTEGASEIARRHDRRLKTRRRKTVNGGFVVRRGEPNFSTNGSLLFLGFLRVRKRGEAATGAIGTYVGPFGETLNTRTVVAAPLANQAGGGVRGVRLNRHRSPFAARRFFLRSSLPCLRLLARGQRQALTTTSQSLSGGMKLLLWHILGIVRNLWALIITPGPGFRLFDIIRTLFLSPTFRVWTDGVGRLLDRRFHAWNIVGRHCACFLRTLAAGSRNDRRGVGISLCPSGGRGFYRGQPLAAIRLLMYAGGR